MNILYKLREANEMDIHKNNKIKYGNNTYYNNYSIMFESLRVFGYENLN